MNTPEEIRRQINRLFAEMAHLAEQQPTPAQFFSEILLRVLYGIAAPAGAVWLQTQEGHLMLETQINIRKVGVDDEVASRQMHDEVLRQTFLSGRPECLPPNRGSNPTNFVILLAPIFVEKKVVGLVEVWQNPRHHPDALPGFLQFLVRMAALSSAFLRNSHLR